MKKALVLLLAVAAATPLLARNTFWGDRGAFEVYSAKCEDPGMLTINLIHAFFKIQDTLITLTPAVASISFTPLRFMEFSGFFDLAGSLKMTFSSFSLYNNNVGPSLKIGYPFYLDSNKNFYIAPGIVGFLSLGLGGPIIGNGATVSARMSPDVGGRGLLSFGLGPVGLHLNGGYRYAMDTTGTNQVLLGGALDFTPIPFTSLVVEFDDNSPTNSIFSPDYMMIRPGLRVSTAKNGGVTFDMGAGIGLGDSVPDWNGIFGVSAAFDLIKHPAAAKIAILSGKITDKTSGSPIAATISFPESEITSISNDPATGEYTINLPPGTYHVHVQAVDYRWREKGVELVSGENGILDFELSKKAAALNLVGTVVDYTTKKPVSATIVVSGGMSVTADAAGKFQAFVSTGTTSVTAQASGYASQTLSATVAPDKPDTLNFELLQEKIRLERIYFDPGSAAIQPASYPALDDAVRIFKSRPKLRVEIQGHTDSIGDDSYNLDLSQRRAEAVRDYLVTRGVESARLTARGYGESVPIGDNRTRAGQQMNRRIEFLILGE